jgi:hypothetical protein
MPSKDHRFVHVTSGNSLDFRYQLTTLLHVKFRCCRDWLFEMTPTSRAFDECMYVIQQCGVSFFVQKVKKATRIQGNTQTERHPRWLFADILDRKACHFQMTTSSLSLSLLWSVGQQPGTHATQPQQAQGGYRGFSSLPKLRSLVIILIPRPRWCV